MPVSPDDGARLTQRIAELYADAELALLTLISSSLVRGIDAPDWAMVKLGELRLIRGRVERELAALDVAAAVAVRSIIDRAYTTGAAQAVGDLNRAAGLTADTLPPALSYAVERLARETLANLAQARPMALRSTLDIYQRTVADAAGTILTGAQTRIQAAQQALDRWASRGITGFRDQAGRNWSLESYAEMAVRSAAGRAAVLGHVEHLQANGLDLVIVSDSPRECSLCLIPGTIVEGPVPTGRTRSEYTGDVIRIVTASGKDLTGTPDHPVLTPRGWVALKDLHPGDEVISDSGQQRLSRVVPDHIEVPTRIEIAGEGVAPILLAGPPRRDLDNNVTYREVRAVLPDRGLLNEGHLSFLEPFRDLLLVGGVGAAAPFLGANDPTSSLGGAGYAADCVMCRIEHGAPLVGSGIGPALAHGTGALRGQDVRGYGIESALQAVTASAGRNAGAAKVVGNHPSADAENGAQLRHALAGGVAADKIVRKSVSQFSGHVWDLTTEPAWFMANGIVTHNCRPYEGKVLSLSGSVAGSITAPSALDGQPTTVTVYSSLADAQANGLFHQNCRHRLGLFLPGATTETGTANPAGYAAEQRQRAIERTIRQWKQRQATALDDTARQQASRKVRGWQAQMRTFLDANPDLRRKYSREQIGQAH